MQLKGPLQQFLLGVQWGSRHGGRGGASGAPLQHLIQQGVLRTELTEERDLVHTRLFGDTACGRPTPSVLRVDAGGGGDDAGVDDRRSCL